MSSILPLVVVVLRVDGERVLVASGRGAWWVPRAWIFCVGVPSSCAPPLDDGARCT